MYYTCTKTVTFYIFISLFFIAELFNEIAQDFMSDPENVEKLKETIKISKEPKRTYWCSLI